MLMQSFRLPTDSTWSRMMPGEQHAYIVFSFACLQTVRDLIRCLVNSMLMLSSPLPVYREYVIYFDAWWTICSLRLLLPRLQGVRDLVRYLNNMPTPSSSSPTYRQYVISFDSLLNINADAVFSFAHLQQVCDLVRYLLNINAHAVFPSPVYRV